MASAHPTPANPTPAKSTAPSRPRLQERYRTEVAPALQAELKIQNRNAVPRVTKILVTMGVGKSIENRARMDQAARDLASITGQKPIVTKAKSAISSFRLRQGMPIGLKVTLRRERMYEFLDRVVSIVIPRIRDFRGLSRKLDGRGNYSFGLSEQSVFPEIQLDKLEFVQGMNITICTNSGTDKPAEALLEKLGMPFRR
ncbi:MAG: 50S ribosomal protein L5 [Planctomycetes bacterium]|nr:50S ribosomal protein L5 [Planctomycetota bacterium]